MGNAFVRKENHLIETRSLLFKIITFYFYELHRCTIIIMTIFVKRMHIDTLYLFNQIKFLMFISWNIKIDLVNYRDYYCTVIIKFMTYNDI